MMQEEAIHMIEKIVWRSVKVKSLEGKMSVSNNALFKRQYIKVSGDYLIEIRYDDVFVFFYQLMLNYSCIISHCGLKYKT